MKRILLSLLIFLIHTSVALSAEIHVIQVKRNIPMTDDEPIYKDYYISGGTKNGLKTNLVVPVVRWINLRENNQAQDQALKILEPVAWLKIIYVQDQLSIARLYETANYKNDPVLDQPGVMMGDLISLENSYLAKPNKVLPRDSMQVIESKKSEEPKHESSRSSNTTLPSEKITNQKSPAQNGAPAGANDSSNLLSPVVTVPSSPSKEAAPSPVVAQPPPLSTASATLSSPNTDAKPTVIKDNATQETTPAFSPSAPSLTPPPQVPASGQSPSSATADPNMEGSI